MNQLSLRSVFSAFTFSIGLLGFPQIAMSDDTQSAIDAMKKATAFMTSRVAVHGGYVYDVTLDLKKRRGEGVATPTEIWVQHPELPRLA